MIIGFYGVNVTELQNWAQAAEQQAAVVSQAGSTTQASLTHEPETPAGSPAEPRQIVLTKSKNSDHGALEWVTNKAKLTWADLTSGIHQPGHDSTLKNELSGPSQGNPGPICSPVNTKTAAEDTDQVEPDDRWHAISEKLQSNSFTRPFLAQAHADKLFLEATGGTLLSGHWPKTSRVLASGILVLGTELNIAISDSPLRLILGVGWFDDGQPQIGKPSHSVTATPPKSVGDLISFEHIADTIHGFIQIMTIKNADGTVRVIILLPGTQNFEPKNNGSPMDLNGDVVTMAGGTSTYENDVRLAMAQARADGQIPLGAQVMLVGHSGGAMVAAHLASDSNFVKTYNVTNVVSVAGPTDNDSIDPSVKFLEIDGENDIVPKLDLEGAPLPLTKHTVASGPNHLVVIVPDKPLKHLSDVIQDHIDITYASEVKAMVKDATDPVLTNFQNELQNAGFLNQPGAKASTITIKMERT